MMLAVVVAVVVTLVVIAVVVALVVIALMMIAAVVSTLVAVVLVVVVVVVSTGDQLELGRGQLRQLLKRHGKGSSSSQPVPGVRRLDGGRSVTAGDR
jgi:hypothetical protein